MRQEWQVARWLWQRPHSGTWLALGGSIARAPHPWALGGCAAHVSGPETLGGLFAGATLGLREAPGAFTRCACGTLSS